MFRSIRRKAQQLTTEECVDILINNAIAVLGVLGDNNYPYTVPINYAYINNKIYIHGAKVGHKIDSISNCSKVSLCVIDNAEINSEKLTTKYKSVIVFGNARIISDTEEIFNVARIFGLKFNSDMDFIDSEIHKYRDSLSCIEVDIEYLTGKMHS